MSEEDADSDTEGDDDFLFGYRDDLSCNDYVPDLRMEPDEAYLIGFVSKVRVARPSTPNLVRRADHLSTLVQPPPRSTCVVKLIDGKFNSIGPPGCVPFAVRVSINEVGQVTVVLPAALEQPFDWPVDFEYQRPSVDSRLARLLSVIVRAIPPSSVI